MPRIKVQGGYQAPEGGKKPALPTTGSGVKPAVPPLDLKVLRSFIEAPGITMADLGALRSYCVEHGITEIDFGGTVVTDGRGNRFETKQLFSFEAPADELSKP